MAKKLGKALLFTTAIGLAAAAAYVYFKKKNDMYFTDMDEDFDDTFEDDVDSEESRSYVELPKEAAPAGKTPVFEEAEEAPAQELPVSEEAEEAPAQKLPASEEAEAVSAKEDTASEELIPYSVEEFFNEEKEDEH